MISNICAKPGAAAYVAGGAFQACIAGRPYALASTEHGIANGRRFQLAANMLTIALIAVVVALRQSWRLGYKFNLGVVGRADITWVEVVVSPGYALLGRGFIPPAIWITATIGQRTKLVELAALGQWEMPWA